MGTEKKEEDLKEPEKAVLAMLFKSSPMLEQAYQLQNALTDIFNKNINKQEAEKRIKEWITLVSKVIYLALIHLLAHYRNIGTVF